jgi:NAD dependent epimerase/dehydratase family enzyme
MRIFRNSLGISLGIGAPAVFIQIGTALLGVDSELVLRGMNVVSSKAKQIGFQFTFPSLDVALEDLNRQC